MKISLEFDNMEELVTQLPSFTSMIIEAASSTYFQKGNVRKAPAVSMVKGEDGNDYVLGGQIDQHLHADGNIIAKTPQEAPESVSKEKADNSAPKTKEAPQSPTVPAEKDDKKSGATAKDVKKLLLLLAKATPSHKDDVKELKNSFSAANFRSFEQLTKERDDGEAMMQSAYDKAKALAEKYDLLEEAS